jgi:2-polyprenyl-6-methoxyphenol hydroxylase-like FAD-dependent oxidoreductase
MSLNIVIAGAGICGMCTALALAQRGHTVTLYERDAPPPEGDADQAFFEWDRRGAAQFRHPHAFLGLMCHLLEQHYPELLQDFFDAGARRVGFADMLSRDLQAVYQPEPGDEKLWILLCRRATMEMVLRRYVERTANIRIVNQAVIEGILAPGGAPCQVQGLRMQLAGVISEVRADVVIDASGRTSRFPKWLRDAGATIEEERDDAEIVYYTRHYQLKPGVTEPVRDASLPSTGDIGYLKFGVFPGDNGNFAIIICLPVGEEVLKRAVREGAVFDAICRSIPGLERWIAADKAVATTDAFGIGDIESVWRHYLHNGVPVAENFFAVGDAAIRTNPLYGRGCSTGILHAHLLAQVLDEVADAPGRARRFAAVTEREIRPIFAASLAEDKRGIQRAKAVLHPDVEARGGVGPWFAGALSAAIGAAAREQLHVVRGALRTFNLMEKPGDFLKDWRVRRTILRYMLRGRSRNAAVRRPAGPSREEMVRLQEIRQFAPAGDDVVE